MTSLTDNPLLKGEEVIYRVKLHPVIYFPTVRAAFFTVAILLGGILFHDKFPPIFQNLLDNYLKWIVLLGFAITGVSLIKSIIKQQFTEIVVTDRRLAIKTGLFATMTWEVLLKQIESTSITRDFPGRMLNYGTVIIHGTGGGDPHIRYVKDPNEFTWHINDGQKQNEERQQKSN